MRNIPVLSVDEKNRAVELLVGDLILTFKHNHKGRLCFSIRSESSSCEDMRLSNPVLAAAYRIAAEEFKKITVH